MNRILLYIPAIVSLLLFSCSKEPDPGPEPEKTSYSAIDGWIYDTMAESYYWYEHLAGKSATDLEATPDRYVNSIRYKDDRFTYATYEDSPSRSAGTRSSLPSILDKVYTFGSERIGYLFYLSFSPPEENGDFTDLKEAFARFKAAGVNRLILDLRFNTGGYYDIMLGLCGMIIPNRNEVFAYREARKNGRYNYQSDYLDPKMDTYCLDLEELHVITSEFTASASELTIHCLNQFIPVYLYGKQTYGKNVGAQLFTATRDNVSCELSLITMRLCDRRGAEDAYPGFLNVGISPDYPLDDRYGYYNSSNNTYYYYGSFGEYDKKREDCEPVLNYILSQPGWEYTERLYATRSVPEAYQIKAVPAPDNFEMIVR